MAERPAWWPEGGFGGGNDPLAEPSGALHDSHGHEVVVDPLGLRRWPERRRWSRTNCANSYLLLRNTFEGKSYIVLKLYFLCSSSADLNKFDSNCVLGCADGGAARGKSVEREACCSSGVLRGTPGAKYAS